MWDYQEYLKQQMEEIEKLKKEGKTVRDIINSNMFCYEALDRCGIPLTFLVPELEGQDMDLFDWDSHTSGEHKWEYFDDTCFGNPLERDRILLGLLYNCGLKRFMEILPEQSKKELINLIKENYM